MVEPLPYVRFAPRFMLPETLASLLAMHDAGVATSPFVVVWPIAIVTLLSLVPFTVAGFGLRELGVAALMKQWYGVPAEPAVLLSLALGTVGIITSVGFGGVALLIETVRTRRGAASKSDHAHAA